MRGLSTLYHMRGTVAMAQDTGSWGVGHGTRTPGIGAGPWESWDMDVYIYTIIPLLSYLCTNTLSLRYVRRALVR